MRRQGTRGRYSVTVGNDIGPERLDVLRFQDTAPGGHLVLAARDRADEALALIVRKLAQIKGALRIEHARAVTRRAIALIEGRTALDVLRGGYLRQSQSRA